MHCFIASGSARPVMGMAGPAGKRPSGGLKPVYRGERLVSSATAKGEGKDDKFWGKGLTPEQLAFLERKEKAARGQGPVMPVSTQCKRCDGQGLCVCDNCKGTGFNEKDKDMGGKAGLQLAVNEEGRENELTGAVTAEPAILSFSNKAEPWRFEQGMPCWVCLGKAVILCGDCGGRGFGAGSLAYGGD